MKKVCGYTRYSTDKQTENSTAYQKKRIEEYCDKNDLTLVAWYHDEEKSGTNVDERPAFLRMVADAGGHRFEAVVVYDVTRGSRDVEDWFGFRKAMRRLGVDVVSTEERLGDIYNPNDFLTELLTVGIGQHHVLTSRIKSKDGVAIKAKQGQFLGGYPPLGYDVVNGQYVINTAEAQAVVKIFDMYASGQSYNKILDALKGTTGKRGRPLGKNSLPTILTNERYIGTYTWNRRQVKIMRKWAGGGLNPDCIRIEGSIPPIVSIGLWERVQKRLKENKKGRNKAKVEYLLSGLIECAHCGSTFVGHCSTSAKGYRTRYYVCGNKYRTRTCSATNINADELEVFVLQQLRHYLMTVDAEQVASHIVGSVNGASDDLSAEKRELGQIAQKIANGVKAVLAGMDVPELQEEIDRLRVRKSELEDIIKRRELFANDIAPCDVVSLFKASLDNLDHNPAAAVRAHITKIYTHIDGSVTVNVGVHLDGCGGQI